MVEIGVVSILFLLSLAANALITRWSAKKVLGLEVSLVRSGLIVAGRSLAALLAGFAVGYAIRLGLQGNVAHKAVQLAGMAMVALLSFFAYWALLGKMTNTSISFWGMTKTVATETVMLLVAAFGIAIVLSFIFYTFQ
ncbi:MAG: hypothetical protein AB2669_07235 [Candidatus Thiodiazotropha endolucinida]|nr:hypothetical protein [Candidatus Thiodiazotropha taylori]MCW4250336.1 hypothetical protein [Candidatus Thiodiazotropha endolucinida]MCG8100838.1 hypothetical protein [Candidatus Thiodiazotropha taylori]MCG8122190.1 hypothetical protein [Candidatus Thiodiazotropha taylori]MCW4286159.1 hypothetical protein [Candidatus Thiodiazotropha endolucinida]